MPRWFGSPPGTHAQGPARPPEGAGIKDRSHKNQAGLPYWQQCHNRLIAPIRAAVERVFGTLKRGYGYRSVRYCSLATNTTQLRVLAIAYNLRRAAAIAG